MTWEILSGLAVLLGSVISIMNVVVKVNRALTSLEETVRRLKDFVERQDGRNARVERGLGSLDKRVTILERASVRGVTGSGARIK